MTGKALPPLWDQYPTGLWTKTVFKSRARTATYLALMVPLVALIPLTMKYAPTFTMFWWVLLAAAALYGFGVRYLIHRWMKADRHRSDDDRVG